MGGIIPRECSKRFSAHLCAVRAAPPDQSTATQREEGNAIVVDPPETEVQFDITVIVASGVWCEKWVACCQVPNRQVS